MTTIDTQREVIDRVIGRIFSNGDGTVYAEDVNEVMSELDISQAQYTKVSNTLDDVVYNLTVVSDFKADSERGWYAHYDGRYPGASVVEFIESGLETDAERGINLIVGLAALSK